MKTIFFSTLTLTALLSFTTHAATIPVSVTAFKNKVGSSGCAEDWNYWGEHLGSAFQEMLITELVKREGRFEILEREQIRDIYNGEHELVNSEESDIRLQKKKFKKARYTFVGSVSEYEYCASSNSGDVQLPIGGLFGSVGVKFSKKNAKVRIDLRVIDTVTGRVVASVMSEGKADRMGVGFDSDDMSYENQSRSPVGEAARTAIQDAVAKVENRLN